MCLHFSLISIRISNALKRHFRSTALRKVKVFTVHTKVLCKNLFLYLGGNYTYIERSNNLIIFFYFSFNQKISFYKKLIVRGVQNTIYENGNKTAENTDFYVRKKKPGQTMTLKVQSGRDIWLNPSPTLCVSRPLVSFVYSYYQRYFCKKALSCQYKCSPIRRQCKYFIISVSRIVYYIYIMYYFLCY